MGLFKGLGATLGRECLGNMAMFGVYELIKQQMVASKVSRCCFVVSRQRRGALTAR